MKKVVALLTVLLWSGPAQAQSDSRNQSIAPNHPHISKAPPGVRASGADDAARRIWGQPSPGPPTDAFAKTQFVSVTSLVAPRAARKAVERARREMIKKKPNTAKATAELEKALALYPSYAEAWLYRGGIHMINNEGDAARRAFENAIAADPRFPYPYPPLALIELREKHYADVARLTNYVLDSNPELIEAHYYRALAYGNLDDHETARESIDAIVRAGEDERFPGVHALLAVLLIREGDLPSAAVEYRRYLELDPESSVAEAAKEFLRSVEQ